MDLEIAKRWDANCKNPASDAGHWTAEPIKEALSWLITEVERLNEADMLAGRALEAKKTDLVDTETALTTLRESITLAAAPLGITGEPEEVVKALVGGMGRLREWKDSVLSAIKWTPEFTAMDWAGDKEGWGFCFELVKYLSKAKGNAEKEVEALTVQLLTAREQGRRDKHALERIANGWSEDWDSSNFIDIAKEALDNALSPKDEVCEWACDSPSEYKTECGHTRPASLGYPLQGCPYCSRPITIKEG